MEQKKVLKVWQMASIVALLVIMLSTMFLPAFHLNGKVIGKMYSYVVKTLKDGTKDTFLSGVVDENIEDEMDKDDIQEFDDNIAELEKDSEIKISSISTIRIMSHSLTSLLLGKDAKQADIDDFKADSNYKKIKNGYNALRISLILVYVFTFVVLVLMIVGFAGKLSKKIPLIISIVYGAIAMIVFGFLRFGLMRIIAGKITKTMDDAIDSFSGISGIAGSSAAFSKLLSYLYSVAFLVALIIAILIIVMSIISLVSGNDEVITDYEGIPSFDTDSYNTYGYDNYESDSFALNTEGMTEGIPFDFNQNTGASDIFPSEIPVTSAEPSVIPVVSEKPVIPTASVVTAMGKVQCTKGVAVGQGFQLPQNRKVIVGKSPQKANLVVNDQRVSNIHCSIRYNPENNTYSVIDHSTNGTYVNGVKLQKNVLMVYPAGTVLCLADGSNEITLG